MDVGGTLGVRGRKREPNRCQDHSRVRPPLDNYEALKFDDRTRKNPESSRKVEVLMPGVSVGSAKLFVGITALVGRIAFGFIRAYGVAVWPERKRVKPRLKDSDALDTTKLALISHTVPPAWSGQAMVIYRMLRDLNPESYCLISGRTEGIDGDPTDYLHTLDGPRYQIPAEFQIRRGFRLGMQHVNTALAIVQRARYFAVVIRREGCNAVLACTGDMLDMPAAYLASRRTGAPFYAYIFDHYSKRERFDPIARVWAQRLEPWLIRRATKVIAPNEILRDDLREDYAVEAAVIHNSCDISVYETGVPEVSNRDGIRIVYTGDIYEANFGALKNLLKAIELLDRKDVKLHLYTARSEEFLDHYGIRGQRVAHPHRQPSEMPRVQQQADILFLPLAFDSPYPEVIRTSATSKMAEYLAAQRPVLVHAPPDSFLAWYFRHYECGLVVDRNEPADLASAIELLLTDAALREKLSQRAWERANADFSLAKAQAQFVRLIGLHP
jgi:glycosyltransferase involved in cell wall biosynthesis